MSIGEATFKLQPAVPAVPVHELRLGQRAVSISELVSAPTALLAGVLGLWRLAADLGWTSPFFISRGLLSHHQSWFAIAVGVPVAASILKRRAPAPNSSV